MHGCLNSLLPHSACAYALLTNFLPSFFLYHRDLELHPEHLASSSHQHCSTVPTPSSASERKINHGGQRCRRGGWSGQRSAREHLIVCHDTAEATLATLTLCPASSVKTSTRICWCAAATEPGRSTELSFAPARPSSPKHVTGGSK